jgi:hypothetical protein
MHRPVVYFTGNNYLIDAVEWEDQAVCFACFLVVTAYLLSN